MCQKVRLFAEFFKIVVGEKFGVIFQPIGFGDFAQHSAGRACGKAVFRDIPRYNAARADHAAVSDRHARADRNVARDPAVVADRDRRAVFPFRDAAFFLVEIRIAIFRAERVQRRKQRNAGAHKNVVPDRYGAYIQHGEIEIGVTPFAERSVAAEIEINRPLKVDAFGAVRQQFVENFFAQGFVALGSLIVFRAQFVGTGAAFHHVVAERIVDFARKHFFAFRHMGTPFVYKAGFVKI